MRRSALALAFASLLTFGVGYVSVYNARASYDTWWQSGNYWRTDLYGTDFYAQTAVQYDPYTDPYFGAGMSIWKTHLRMDVIYNVSSEYLNCDASDLAGSNGSGEKNWYNAPFPLDYYNTPAWDYFTWTVGRTFTVTQQFGASRDEQCNLSNPVPVGAYFYKTSSGSAIVGGPW